MMKSVLQKISNYQPLMVIIGVTLLTSFILALANAVFSGMHWMRYGMGLFFILLAMFKLFDINGFADGFQKYDIIAKHTRVYAYGYPLLELALGLLYLSAHYLYFTNVVTLILMIISAIGVINSVVKGMNLKCACLGTALNVPLSTVSIIENAGMGVMAAMMLIFI
jgi:hypothetical protein